MNLPEIPRNINIGDINIKVPSLSPFWAAFQLSSAGPMCYWCSSPPPSSAVNTEKTVLYMCIMEPLQLILPPPSFFSHEREISCGLFLSCAGYKLQVTPVEGFAQECKVWFCKASRVILISMYLLLFFLCLLFLQLPTLFVQCVFSCTTLNIWHSSGVVPVWKRSLSRVSFWTRHSSLQ